MNTSRPLLVLLAVVSLNLLLVTPPPVDSQQRQPGNLQPVQKGPAPFALFGTFDLLVDGKKDENARLYQSGNRGVLVRSDALAGAVLVVPSGRQVLSFNNNDLVELADGRINLPADPSPAARSTFQMAAEGPPPSRPTAVVSSLSLDRRSWDRTARMRLVKHNPAYAQKAEKAVLQPQYVDALKATKEPTHIKVYFGSWCSTCADLMPGILKLEEVLAGTKITFDYYGIPQDYNDPEVKRDGVSRLPTGLIFRGGEEVARIEAHGWRYPDLALLNTIGSSR